MFGAPFPGVNAVKRTLLDHQFSNASASSTTFSMNCGAGGVIVACIQVAVNGSISSVVIGGVTATQVALGSRASSSKAAVYVAVGVPAGTQNVVVTTSALGQEYGAQLYSIIGQASSTPTSTASDSVDVAPTAILNVPAGGCVIGTAMEFAGTSTSTTWTGMTKDVDDPNGVTTAVYTSASGEFPAANPALTVTATFNAAPAADVGAWAVWGP